MSAVLVAAPPSRGFWRRATAHPSFVIGAVSDAMTAAYGAEALRYAMLGGLVLYLLAGVLMWLAAPALRDDWVD